MLFNTVKPQPRLIGLILLGAAALLASGCRPSGIEELSSNELFTLEFGKMEDQLDLFQIKGELLSTKNRLIMRDGLFYLANGNSSKIMEFSSYGDLIFLLYNSNTNPKPVSFNPDSSADLAATRQAVTYPLMSIGEIAVDSEKHLYVEDAVPEERQVKDKELGVVLNRSVLRFDRHGKLTYFIGQEGMGGTPFPFIDGLYVTEKDELVVICRTSRSWLVFWYSRQGTLLYQVEIDLKNLPLPQKDAIPMVAKIHPDLRQPLLYLMLYYFQNTIDESTKSTSSVKNLPARIYSLALDSGRYGNYLEVPQDGFRKELVGTKQIEVPFPSYELLGVSGGGYFFLLRAEDQNLYQLLILNDKGRIVNRRVMVIEDSELYFKSVRLSSTGIIYALLCQEYGAKILWWRSDKLLREEKE